MPDEPLSVEIFDELRPLQNIDGFEITGREMLSILSMYDPYGIWKLDLESAHVTWSRDVFVIHEIEYKDGPVDLNAAIAAYHPDDAKVVGQLIEECIQKKSGFRFVLRLRTSTGGYKLVKSSGRYRVNSKGREEVIGLFSQFALPIRSIAAVS